MSSSTHSPYFTSRKQQQKAHAALVARIRASRAKGGKP